MGGALRRGMHPLVFHIKRAHWRCLARLEPDIRHLDMTCARFDVMHAIDSSEQRALTQAQLARQLGVARQTIWEMVLRMVRHRLVTKSDDPNIGRVVVRLTAKGRRRVARSRVLLGFDRVQRALRTCFSWLEPEHARRDIAMLKYNARFVARGFGDTSTYGDFIDECFNPKPPVFGQSTAPPAGGACAPTPEPAPAPARPQPSQTPPLSTDEFRCFSVLDAITAWRGGPLSLRFRQ